MTSTRDVGIGFDAGTATWILQTPATTYAVRLPGGRLMHVYWGPALDDREVSELPVRAALGTRRRASASFESAGDGTQEYPVDGGVGYGMPSLQVRFGDGTRDLQFEYVGHQIAARELSVSLRDSNYPLDVVLRYRIAEDTDVIERQATLRLTAGEAWAARFDAASWVVPPREGYRVSRVSGLWGAETQLHRDALPDGEMVLTSRRGITSHQANPWVMVDDGTATEEHGEVWSVALAWSGSWRMAIQRTPLGRVSVTAGFGHDGVMWRLGRGDKLSTPVSAGLFCAGGFGAASRAWHHYARRHVLPHPEESRPVLYNSWEATYFDIDAGQQAALAARAAEIGAETFVVDDGWFRPHSHGFTQLYPPGVTSR